MNQEKRIYTMQCSRCAAPIETVTAPAAKMTGFLCNSCHMKWKDIEQKLLGHVYQDEMREAFINFVNSLAHLRNTTLRGF